MATPVTKQVIAAIMVSLAVGAAGASMWLDRDSRTVERFHRIFHDMAETTWDQNTHWLGTRIQKLPMDLEVYQELLWETKPDVLLEMGTLNGGSALYFASIFDLMGHGRVITVDIERQPNLPKHARIAYLLGSSTSPEIVRQIEALVKPGVTGHALSPRDFHAVSR
jgi:cephalosporin hydroxylase